MSSIKPAEDYPICPFVLLFTFFLIACGNGGGDQDAAGDSDVSHDPAVEDIAVEDLLTDDAAVDDTGGDDLLYEDVPVDFPVEDAPADMEEEEEPGPPDPIEAIGAMYDCPLARNVDFIAGNLGYAFVGDEIAYAMARLVEERGCATDQKYVIFYVSTVNFPSDGAPSGEGADIEQGWIDYWNYLADRFAALGYSIIIHPSPFIINDEIRNVDYPPGLRPLLSSDLNMDAADIPAVYECRDGRRSVIASIYDPKTFDLALDFYNGIKNVFGARDEFVKISIVPPSDFGEYGFPVGYTTRWWQGSDDLWNCYKTGDPYAWDLIDSDPPSYAQYNGKLNDFRAALTTEVKTMFPGRRYMLYLGYGNDDNPAHGFSYEEAVAWAVDNGVDLHSSHGFGIDVMQIPLDKIAVNKPAGYEFTFENVGTINEHIALKNIYHAAKYDVTGIELYASFLFDHFFTYHFLYTLGPAPEGSLYESKDVTFDSAGHLGSLRSSRLAASFVDVPVEGAVLDGDANNLIGGWGYFEDPYGDHLNYRVLAYAGHLIEDSPYPPDEDYGGYHPEFMRLVASAETTGERAEGLGDTSRFGFLWKPDLASGKAVLRLFLVNEGSEIVSELQHSPLIVNIDGIIEGSAKLDRLDYNYGLGNVCTREYRMSGSAVSSEAPGEELEIYVINDYFGELLATGTTDSEGDFTIEFTVPEADGTVFLAPRAYAHVDNDGDTTPDLVGLQTELYTNVGGHPYLANKFLLTVMNCEWP